MNISQEKIDQAKAVFRKKGGLLRTGEILSEGVHPRILYYLRDRGDLEMICRGVYRLVEMELPDLQDITTVATTVRSGVICLISALSFHEMTTQIPHEIYVAISRTMAYPRHNTIPTRYFRFSQDVFQIGVEIHKIGGKEVKIYSPEKTIVDCFKFRNKIGLDVAVEALKYWKEKKGHNMGKLIEYAGICRVYNVIKPYVEAMI